MYLRDWYELPERMKNHEVRKYYQIIKQKKISLGLKRIFDITASSSMLFFLSPIFLVIGIAIKTDSSGPVIFKQVRITQYGKRFNILKFRTMMNHAEKLGTQITLKGDTRITRVGKFLRKRRLDELPQLVNILAGDMSFVGARPEVPKYVKHYTDEMLATLLLPAGLTAEASICYKDEEMLLDQAEDVDQVYIEQILPDKMRYNLKQINEFSVVRDLKTMVRTFAAVVK